jgi:hypothetical protein
MSRVMGRHENTSSVRYKGLGLLLITIQTVDNYDTANSMTTMAQDGGEFALTDEQLAQSHTTESIRVNRSKTGIPSFQTTSASGKSSRPPPNRSARHTPVLVQHQPRRQRHHRHGAKDVVSGEEPCDWIVVGSRSQSASACTRPGLRRTESRSARIEAARSDAGEEVPPTGGSIFSCLEDEVVK